ncbi:synaptic vesicle 2-related protein-like isoform X2 [Rhopilema esculentum]|uniref:synaptic vesicle 2-related protein-like isoform X2 n=1 Tax=Rhopilema esculentum TaxID=499914 RepID=UPI0031D0B97F
MDGIDETKEDDSSEIRESICINDLQFDPTEYEESCLPRSQHYKDELTVDEIIDRIGFGRFQIRLMFMAGFVWMADGSEMMLLSILAPTLKCFWYLSSFQEAFITTAVFFGLMIGSGFWGIVSDKYGRKKTLLLSTAIVLYFGILSSRAPSYGWILAVRLFVGFGIGGAPQAVTLVTELLPSAIRGKCIILLEMFWAVGSIFAVSLALGTVNTIGWRWFLALITVPLFPFLLLSKWVPESPRYLLTVGRKKEALEILKNIAKENGKEMPAEKIITSEIPVGNGKLMDLFGRDYRRTTLTVWIIWFSAAFCYYGIVLLATEMFQTKIDACHPKGISVESMACGCNYLTTRDYTDFMWTTVAEVPGILITIPIVEWIGRKKTLALEFFAAAVFFLLMLICLNRTAEVVFMFGVRACVTGAFQTAYVYTPEVFPTNVRSFGLGSSSSFARIGAMTTPFIAQVLFNSSFSSAILIYAAVLFLCSIASLLLPIETKGRVLEETTSMSVSYHKDGYDRLR